MYAFINAFNHLFELFEIVSSNKILFLKRFQFDTLDPYLPFLIRNGFFLPFRVVLA